MTSCDVACCTYFFSFLYQNKEQSKTDGKQNSFLGNKAVVIAKIAV